MFLSYNHFYLFFASICPFSFERNRIRQVILWWCSPTRTVEEHSSTGRYWWNFFWRTSCTSARVTVHSHNIFIFFDENKEEWRSWWEIIYFLFFILGIWWPKVCWWWDLELHTTTRTIRRCCWRVLRFHIL